MEMTSLSGRRGSTTPLMFAVYNRVFLRNEVSELATR